ncbi:hypothetical protein RHSIM_Rhsim03G0155400 [Rhododendron simsii]|uniref:ATP synthase F1 complex delta/epsilon subunit N-terminal domain-containing protein n=1 Tax=Rhododendron simsii TaxID=118357 RepID=A0A834LR42_RHOSS|nr:hypothetical protein RHSIM_Rhsim03G0155400 [Rhododendron simsii]
MSPPTFHRYPGGNRGGFSVRAGLEENNTKLGATQDSLGLHEAPPTAAILHPFQAHPTTGQMGVLPGHVATITELKPGVLSVHEGNIVAIEAVPLDRMDPVQVQKGLSEFTKKLNSASTDWKKAEAQIGVDVHSAMNSALTG